MRLQSNFPEIEFYYINYLITVRLPISVNTEEIMQRIEQIVEQVYGEAIDIQSEE